jgi:hypothetical protein
VRNFWLAASYFVAGLGGNVGRHLRRSIRLVVVERGDLGLEKIP